MLFMTIPDILGVWNLFIKRRFIPVYTAVYTVTCLKTHTGLMGAYLCLQEQASGHDTVVRKHIPQCTILCKRNEHMCAHFCYKMVHCGIFVCCVVRFMRICVLILLESIYFLILRPKAMWCKYCFGNSFLFELQICITMKNQKYVNRQNRNNRHMLNAHLRQ